MEREMRQAVLFAAIAMAFIGCSCSKSNRTTVQEGEEARAVTSSGLQRPDLKIEATNSVVSHASSQGVPSQTVGQNRSHVTLPSESLVTQANAVSTDKVGRLIQSDNFDAFVNKLASESYANPLAQDVTALEKQALENFFRDKGTLRNFACGTGVCAGTIALGKEPSSYNKFADNFLENGPANASLLDYQVKLDNGEFEQRLVMSIDPNLNGVTIPVHP
jgi:hypothetical protein